MKYSLPAAAIVFVFLIACDAPIAGRHDNKSKAESMPSCNVWDSIRARDTLIAVIDFNSINYFIYRAEPMGYQYELLKTFTKNKGLQLKLLIENNVDRAFEMLDCGRSDVIALGLTVTLNRSQEVLFTDPYLVTRQVLVQAMPDGFEAMTTRDEIESHLLRNPIDLAGKEVHVQSGSIFEERLKSLSNEIGDSIVIVQQNKEVDQLIEAVAQGEIPYTVADEHIALVNAKYYPNIDVKTYLSFPQKIAWAVKKDGGRQLADSLNAWLDTFNRSLAARLLYNKYFKNSRSARIARSPYHSYKGGNLSPYDDIIKSTAEAFNWDWRLLASLIYQESEFKPQARSWVGAFGLMQLMPHVMELYAIDTTASAELQIKTGMRYMGYLDRQLPESIQDSSERIKFLLAAYNMGIGHVLDARRLASKYGKDPDVWTANVDEFILKKALPEYYTDTAAYYGYARGEETYAFVEEILNRYEHYKQLISGD